MQLCYVVPSQPQTDDMVDVAAVLSRWHLVVLLEEEGVTRRTFGALGFIDLGNRSGGSQAGQEASGVSLGVHQIAVINIRKLHACLQATHLLRNCAGMQDSSLKQMIAIAQLCLALR